MNDGNDEAKSPGKLSDEVTLTLTKVIEHIAAEQYALAALEDIFSPKPAKLANSDAEADTLTKRSSDLIDKLSHPQHTHLVVRANDGSPNGNTERLDEYPAAALAEVVNMFHRTRRSVCRAQMTLVGSHLINTTFGLFSEMPREMQKHLSAAVGSSFWEHAETAYIRVASYWDRVGQLLDFVFFSIRQFERDGFTAVMDRIHSNFAQMDAVFSVLPEWRALRGFQISEREDGLKWLLRRRNLLVHSAYLRPLTEIDSANGDDGTTTLFRSEFNHLEESIRKKLAPGSALEEIERLNLQLGKAAELYPAVIRLCEYRAVHR